MGTEQNTSNVDTVTGRIRSNVQMCVIHVMFPLESDEQALKVNSLISEAVKDIIGVRKELRITSGMGG